MAKIILTNGVINVEETYEEVLNQRQVGDWLELIEDNRETKHIHKAHGIIGDYRVYVNINHIQCVKP